MKALKTISKSLLIVGLLTIIVSCTNDPITEDVNSEDFVIEIQKSSEEYESVLVTFHEGVREPEKESYRQFYSDENVLISWSVCDKIPHTEIWTIRCSDIYPCKQGNPPIKHDKPVPGQTERIIYGDCPK